MGKIILVLATLTSFGGFISTFRKRKEMNDYESNKI